MYYGHSPTERNVLTGILLTPGQRLYLWISGVRDAAGRPVPLVIHYVMPAAKAACQAARDAWRIVNKLYGLIRRGPLRLTERELEELRHEFNIFKGYLEGIKATGPPELVREIKLLRDVADLATLLLRQEIPEEANEKIISLWHSLNHITQRLNCPVKKQSDLSPTDFGV